MHPLRSKPWTLRYTSWKTRLILRLIKLKADSIISKSCSSKENLLMTFAFNLQCHRTCRISLGSPLWITHILATWSAFKSQRHPWRKDLILHLTLNHLNRLCNTLAINPKVPCVLKKCTLWPNWFRKRLTNSPKRRSISKNRIKTWISRMMSWNKRSRKNINCSFRKSSQIRSYLNRKIWKLRNWNRMKKILRPSMRRWFRIWYLISKLLSSGKRRFRNK